MDSSVYSVMSHISIMHLLKLVKLVLLLFKDVVFVTAAQHARLVVMGSISHQLKYVLYAILPW